jgi:predicted GNAT superfamily acetyltransferase
VTGEGKLDLRLLEGAETWRRASGLADQQISSSGADWLAEGAVGVGAFEEAVLVAAARAVIAPDDAAPPRVAGERWNVSHLALDPSASTPGLEEHLMLVQREQALSLGLQLMTWAQDPLDVRLTRLAVRRLGAVSRWLRDRGDSTHPVLEAEWWIRSPRVKALLAGTRPRLELVDALEAGAPKLNAGVLREDDLLWPTDEESAPEGAMALIEVPLGIHALAAQDAALAGAWRRQIQRLLIQAFDAGYWLTDLLELRGERSPRAYYLLIDGERTLS